MRINEDPAFTRVFLAFILGRNEQLKADLIDHWFNSSEKRLARILISLADAATTEEARFTKVAVDQETLAKMVGTTRSRINHFMNKFRDLGYVEYNGDIKVHRSLTSVLLQERRPQSRLGNAPNANSATAAGGPDTGTQARVHYPTLPSGPYFPCATLYSRKASSRRSLCTARLRRFKEKSP